MGAAARSAVHSWLDLPFEALHCEATGGQQVAFETSKFLPRPALSQCAAGVALSSCDAS
jgi:hypothetical protein